MHPVASRIVSLLSAILGRLDSIALPIRNRNENVLSGLFLCILCKLTSAIFAATDLWIILLVHRPQNPLQCMAQTPCDRKILVALVHNLLMRFVTFASDFVCRENGDSGTF